MRAVRAVVRAVVRERAVVRVGERVVVREREMERVVVREREREKVEERVVVRAQAGAWALARAREMAQPPVVAVIPWPAIPWPVIPREEMGPSWWDGFEGWWVLES